MWPAYFVYNARQSKVLDVVGRQMTRFWSLNRADCMQRISAVYQYNETHNLGSRKVY